MRSGYRQRRGWVLITTVVLAGCSAATPMRDRTPSAGSGGGAAAVSGENGAGSGAIEIAGSIAPAGRSGSAQAGTVSLPQAGVAAFGGSGALAGNGASAGSAAAAAGAPAPPPAAGDWPAADPSKTGPFMTVTENSVGHNMDFTMFRPKDLTRRYPVITWGNGTGTMPSTYRQLLTLYASHGFIVIASNSENVAMGTPPPMLDGVTWVLEQDMMAGTTLYQHVDRDNIGATGHSQGAFAASSAGSDPRIKTIAPIETLGAGPGLHGPALGLCGSMDTTVPCSNDMRSYSAINDQPVMYAELMSADHTNWIFSLSGGQNPYYTITTAWFRVHLMNDTALRPMFYGACSICQDTATWITMRKKMDQ